MVNRFVVIFILTICTLFGIFFAGWNIVSERRSARNAIADAKREDILITVIEGKRWEEIAGQMDRAGITSFADFKAILEATKSPVEGTLFPETYRFFPATPAGDVIEKLRLTYARKLVDAAPTNDQLILASIVEREAQNDVERSVIAGIYQNRLSVGMSLDADPTVQYAKDTQAYAKAGKPRDFEFWGAITQADYRGVISPYNTYINRGLPPGPICNPGVKSILAAMNPADHDYTYFFHRNGELVLSKSLAEHQRKFSIKR
ncbi:MAG TPA: endolytic transglycosylase MltG [Verrucomicrobiae bacterium]|nr:endolytic transglycosylase MltG [Verrucomicrobiae bacterium]